MAWIVRCFSIQEKLIIKTDLKKHLCKLIQLKNICSPSVDSILSAYINEKKLEIRFHIVYIENSKMDVIVIHMHFK